MSYPVRQSYERQPRVTSDQYNNIDSGVHVLSEEVEDQFQGISYDVIDRMYPTFRNAVNNFARDTEANTNIHYASKFAILGAFVSVVGALESVARLVSTVVSSFFAYMFDGEEDSDWRYTDAEQDVVYSAPNLLGYHLTNIATLGFFGFSIRDRGFEQQSINSNSVDSAYLDKGDAYGLVDVNLHPARTYNPRPNRSL